MKKNRGIIMYKNLDNTRLSTILAKEQARYEEYKAMNLKLDMSRGKPCKEQLDLSMDMLDCINSKSNLVRKIDYRNYGIADGIPELKELFGALLGGISKDEIIVAYNASLNLMYDTIQRAMQFGILGNTPWNKEEKLKWLCPVPGYDRHFAITELFGFDMINVPCDDNGPDMDMIEELVKDPTVKGMWCVPKYSNPMGIIYSDEVVKRLAALKPAAKDFRIMWDNAYMVHSLYGQDQLLDIYAEAKKNGNEDIVYIFGSTSRVTFSGAGVAFMAGSKANMDDARKYMGKQTIGPDKLSQLMHATYFNSVESIYAHMEKHAAILRPKFEAVLEILEEEFWNTGIATWNKPRGGYFISCFLAEGTAKRTVALAKEAGVVFTGAGATYPYKNDPADSNVRIAPTLPPMDELITAMRIFCCCAKVAYLEKLTK
ncbi:MAG: aminotransferase class I/II-fold pyridoxal phosphate-dependent enzyme [Clostridia bacterium]|nr:aminotransferase class I/II-fold pyridoxal phosphate-dependent enzyme [Clostridia bacterium]